MPLAVLTAVAIATQAPAPASIVTGQVLDPGNLPVAAAAVRVECSGQSVSTATDTIGRFELRTPGSAECLIEVRRDGFVTWMQPLGDGSRVVVRLALRAHHESLTVRGSGELVIRPASGMSDGDLLRQMTHSPDRMIQMARAMAGAGQTEQRVYIDGSPRAVLPTAERFGQVLVNPDPYSAAFGDLNGARVEVETAPLARAWRYALNVSPGALSAEHPLGAGHQWRTRSYTAGVSGPLPGTALAWSAGVRRVRRDQEAPLLSPTAPETIAGVSQSREETDGVYASGSYHRGATRLMADVNVQDDRAFAAGAGVLVLPEAATDVSSRIVEMNASMRRETPRLAVTSSGTVRLSTRVSRARSDQQGFAAVGSLVSGGAPVSLDEMRGSFVWWAGRVAGRAGGRPWRAGATVNASKADSTWTPNPHGVIELVPDGSRALFTQVEKGSGTSRNTETTFATYGEMQVVRTSRWTVTTGLRMDARRGAAIAVSPRISGTLELSGSTVTFGAGQFVEDLDAASLLPLYMRASGGMTHLASDASGVRAGVTRVAILPERQRLASVGASRPLGIADLAAEYRWSWTDDAPSVVREVTSSGWSEVYGSMARRRDDELRMRLSVGRGARALVAYYTWRRAMDTADGWWGAATSAAGGEWAPASGIAAHEGGFVLSLKAPASISASLAGTLSSGPAMDVVFAPASLAEALQAPLRPGRRNSAVGPSTASLQLFASRPVTIDAWRVRGRIGAQVTNLLGRKNLLAPVSVVGSPLFGRATAAGAARSLSIWFALAP